MPRVLVSACLLGLPARYDGRSRTNRELMGLLTGLETVSICPEQLGGLSTPRPAASIVGPPGTDGHDVIHGQARVINSRGEDVSQAFLQGAREVSQLAGRLAPAAVILRSNSPACGPRTRTDAKGQARPCGVTAAWLGEAGWTLLEVDKEGVGDEVRRYIEELTKKTSI